MLYTPIFLFFFFFNDTATTEIYTLSLHDALPISKPSSAIVRACSGPSATSNWLWAKYQPTFEPRETAVSQRDRKSTRLNSSHLVISYAVFCLKKKKKKRTVTKHTKMMSW